MEHLKSKGRRRPFVVHRIDRDTSGLVMFATRADAQGRLKDQFRRHEAERIYLAVVYGVPSPSRGTWRDHLVWDQAALIQKQTHARDPEASEATCDYEVLETFGDTALIEVSLSNRQAQPDPAPGETARAHAGGRAALRLWSARSSKH